MIYRCIFMFCILACQSAGLCLSCVLFSSCRWFLLCRVRSLLCTAFTCCMLGNASTLMCLTASKSILLPDFYSFHTMVLSKRTITLFFFCVSAAVWLTAHIWCDRQALCLCLASKVIPQISSLSNHFLQLSRIEDRKVYIKDFTHQSMSRKSWAKSDKLPQVLSLQFPSQMSEVKLQYG